MTPNEYICGLAVWHWLADTVHAMKFNEDRVIGCVLIGGVSQTLQCRQEVSSNRGNKEVSQLK